MTGKRLAAALAALVITFVGYTVWTKTHPVTLTASTEIAATPDRVWRVLTDFPAYPRWNPFVTSAEVTTPGGLKVGARMRNVVHDRTGDTTLTPKVLTVAPGRELRWTGSVGPGWVADGEHRFTIEPIAPDRVRLTQTERFTGIAVPFIGGWLHNAVLPQFRAMNHALAQRAEAAR